MFFKPSVGVIHVLTVEYWRFDCFLDNLFYPYWTRGILSVFSVNCPPALMFPEYLVPFQSPGAHTNQL